MDLDFFLRLISNLVLPITGYILLRVENIYYRLTVIEQQLKDHISEAERRITSIERFSSWYIHSPHRPPPTPPD